jgi:hypothetical protein
VIQTKNVNLNKTALLTVSTRGIIKTTALHAFISRNLSARSTIIIFFILKVGKLLFIIIYSDFRDRSIFTVLSFTVLGKMTCFNIMGRIMLNLLEEADTGKETSTAGGGKQSPQGCCEEFVTS